MQGEETARDPFIQRMRGLFIVFISQVQTMLIVPLVASCKVVCRTGQEMVITSSGWFYLLVLMCGCHLPYEQTRRCPSLTLSGAYNVNTRPLVR